MSTEKTAEDRALDDWERTPWPGDSFPWSPLEQSVEATRIQFVEAFRAAFRAGYRAGKDAPPEPFNPVPEHESAAWALMVVKRIEALEQHPERLGSSEKHIDQRVGALEQRTSDMLSAEAQADLESRVSDIEQWRDAIRKAGA